MLKPIMLTDHARCALEERALELTWVERTVRTPEWSEPDPADPALERRFCTLPECGGRILRVVCEENDAMIMVVTAFLDRRARRPK